VFFVRLERASEVVRLECALDLANPLVKLLSQSAELRLDAGRKIDQRAEAAE
jgi:hypothetical protein